MIKLNERELGIFLDTPSWHFKVGFHIIEKLTSRPIPKIYKPNKRRKMKMAKPKPKKSHNPMLFSKELIKVKKNPFSPENMKSLRNTILPVDREWDKVLKWLNTVTTRP